MKRLADVENVLIDYDLGQHGWSSFTLRIGDRCTTVGAFSYLTDALDDVVDIALAIVTSTYSVQVSFDGEPMEWRLIIDPDEMPDRRLRIMTFPDINRRAPDTAGTLQFETRVKPDDFARAVQSTAHAIWDRYGEKGYRDVWKGRRGFPVEGLNKLDAALSKRG